MLPSPSSLPGAIAQSSLLAVAAVLLCGSSAAVEREAAEPAAIFVDSWLSRNLDGLVELYQHLHAHPELSLEEKQTAALVAAELAQAGYRVTAGVGGYGVVGLLENGAGPTLLIRGDMDALPVSEATGLAYASRVRAQRPDGSSVGVMHACGHDVHVANLLGTARLLERARDRWSGSLLILAQPAEELGRGARMMIEDGLFERVPRPDYVLALHVEPELPAGQVGYTAGWAFANVDAVDVTFFGRGGHGARPHQAVDPIVASAHFITALQTLVSRRVDPQAAAVVTVGSLHAGSKHNVIPDEARMQLTVRSYSAQVRELLLQGIDQMATDTCRLFGCPRPPEVNVRKEYTPAVYNDPKLLERALVVFRRELGEERVVEREPSMGGEDFGRYGRQLAIPSLLFRLGATHPELHAAHQRPGGPVLPTLHSSGFAPLPGPTLETGVRALSHLALEILARP